MPVSVQYYLTIFVFRKINVSSVMTRPKYLKSKPDRNIEEMIKQKGFQVQSFTKRKKRGR